MPNQDGRPSINLQGLIIAVLSGVLFALITCCVALLLLSVAVASGLIPENTMEGLCIFLCALTAMMGGRYAVKRGGVTPLLTGVFTGLALCLLILVIGFCGYDQPNLGEGGLWVPVAAMGGGTLAGLSGPGKKAKRRRKK